MSSSTCSLHRVGTDYIDSSEVDLLMQITEVLQNFTITEERAGCTF
jgi:hypothetical protein